MSINGSKKGYRQSYIVFSVLLLAIVGTAIFWFYQKSTKDFVDFHRAIAQESTTGVAQQISTFIKEQNRLVALFANEHLSEILKVKADPENEDTMEELADAIKLYFPNHFSFTLAGLDGEPLFPDFDGFISELCKRDIKTFVQEHNYNPYIHPNSESYHFDVMANFGENKNDQGILFISFHADIMGDILKSVEVLDHSLMLIYPEKKDLIEVLSAGARNHLDRDDYRLSENEKSLILHRESIAGTRWEAIDFQVPGLFSKKESELRLVSIFIVLIIGVICLIFVIKISRKEKQREKLEMEKNQMVGLVAHEFRTPLTGILGAIQLLKYEGLNDKQSTILDVLYSSSTRMQLLIDDFMDVQVLESGNFKLELDEVPLPYFVTSVLESNKMYGEKFEVKFELLSDVSTFKDVNFIADSNRAHQVLSNLLSNAVKYGGSNKTVEIDVKVTNKDVRFEIQDHGKGVPLAFQSKIFQQFSKAGNQQVSGVESTGLGLSICKKIMEKHNGEIGFNSKENEGTCFYVIFPR